MISAGPKHPFQVTLTLASSCQAAQNTKEATDEHSIQDSSV